MLLRIWRDSATFFVAVIVGRRGSGQGKCQMVAKAPPADRSGDLKDLDLIE